MKVKEKIAPQIICIFNTVNSKTYDITVVWNINNSL